MVQNDFFKTLPDIIKAASSSSQGVLALMVLGLGVLAYLFFGGREANQWVRSIIFLLLLGGVALYGHAIVGATGNLDSAEIPGTFTITGTIVDAQTNDSVANAVVSVIGVTGFAASDSNGIFTLPLAAPSSFRAGDVMQVRVAKNGYGTKTFQIRPPVGPLNLQILIL